MTDWLRRAGEGIVGDLTVRWAVAEGSRGRRWRWTLSDRGSLVATTLLELTPDGVFARLERDSVAGLLTAHPEPGGRTLHGNLVRAGGVDPIALPWRPGMGVAIDGDPFGSALCAGDGELLVVAPDGGVAIAARSGRPAAALAVDARGVPQLADAGEWPLEV
ncbi:MAG TPA: hypothetical protein VFM38_14710 [Candidatus Limnocylindrales bacterium]|nr:hypothetical protein [Candidatus Limnocylindrales bacterium]